MSINENKWTPKPFQSLFLISAARAKATIISDDVLYTSDGVSMTTLRNIKSATVEELVKQYENAASMHGEGRKQGDLKVTNRAADTVASVYRELRRRGGDVRQAILPLLLSDHPGIRGWAAAHALEFAPEQGQPILESLAKENGLIGLSALMTLKVWREGNLRFP